MTTAENGARAGQGAREDEAAVGVSDKGDCTEVGTAALVPTLTVVEYRAEGPLAKTRWAEQEGDKLVLRSAVAGLQATSYVEHRLPVATWARDYAELVARLTPCSYVCHARLKDGTPSEGRVLSKARLALVGRGC